jgi:tetratricopeptide (TPR) repeat protein
MHAFDSKELKRLFGIPASHIRALIRAGHINPVKKAGHLTYSFQDLIVLRTAGSLRAAKIPAQKINRTLREIRASLPATLPLSGLAIIALGDRIVVREGGALRESDTGQYALALEVTEQGGDLRVIDRREEFAKATSKAGASGGKGGREGGRERGARTSRAAPRTPDTAPRTSSTAHTSGTARTFGPARTSPALPPREPPTGSAEELFERATELEETDAAEAQAAYEAALASDPRHLEARLNLGRLLHLEGRLDEAEAIYRGSDGKEALLAYNLGVLLEDLGRESDAMASYREALGLDPALADAHYNLALLYERAGRPKDALRHLLAYRRLSGETGG